MNKFKTHLLILWPGVLVISFLIAGYLVYSDALEKTRGKIESTLATLSAMNEDLANSQDMVDRYETARRDLEPYLSVLFPSSEPQALIDDLKRLAREHDVRLSDFTLDVPKFIEIRGRNETISIVPFEISFRGGFFDLGKFLERLEKTPYLHTISSSGMSAQDDTGGNLTLSLRGAFRFFSKEAVEEIIADGA